MNESWVVFTLVIVASLLLQYDRGGGDVVEVAANWEQLIVLPRKPPSRIAIGYCKYVGICSTFMPVNVSD